MLSLGPDGVQETLRKGLAMGAARAVQLKADEVPFDGLAIAQALAAELKDGGYDLILFGRMATDSANGTVGPMTAELLGLPCVTAISHLEIADGRGTARRELEGSAETLEFPLPAVLTIDEGIARPRLASLKGIMAAKKKPLEVKPAQLGEARLVVESMALPPDRPPGRIIGEGADAVPELLQTAPNRSEGAVMPPILAFAESRKGELRKVAFETVTAARQAADASGGGEVHAMLLGGPGIAERAAEALGRYGADVVIVVEHPALRQYNPEVFAATVAERLRSGELSRRLLPRIGPGARPGSSGRGPAQGEPGLRRDRVRASGRLGSRQASGVYRQGDRHPASEGHAGAAVASSRFGHAQWSSRGPRGSKRWRRRWIRPMPG